MELGIISGLVIILILEVSRYFRSIRKNNDDIQELKNRITALENQLNK